MSSVKAIDGRQNVKSFRNSFDGADLAHSVFRDRLAFARFYAHLHLGRYITNSEIARAVGVDPAWVTKWSKRPDAPDSRVAGRALAELFGVAESWLMDDEGEAPEAELWTLWQQARGTAPKSTSLERALQSIDDALERQRKVAEEAAPPRPDADEIDPQSVTRYEVRRRGRPASEGAETKKNRPKGA